MSAESTINQGGMVIHSFKPILTVTSHHPDIPLNATNRWPGDLQSPKQMIVAILWLMARSTFFTLNIGPDLFGDLTFQTASLFSRVKKPLPVKLKHVAIGEDVVSSYSLAIELSGAPEEGVF